MGMCGWVYMLASAPHGTLYVGVTNNVARRIEERREGMGSAFCRRSRVRRLVRTEGFDRIGAAIHREKGLKKRLRAWKVQLIGSESPA